MCCLQEGSIRDYDPDYILFIKTYHNCKCNSNFLSNTFNVQVLLIIAIMLLHPSSSWYTERGGTFKTLWLFPSFSLCKYSQGLRVSGGLWCTGPGKSPYWRWNFTGRAVCGRSPSHPHSTLCSAPSHRQAQDDPDATAEGLDGGPRLRGHHNVPGSSSF